MSGALFENQFYLWLLLPALLLIAFELFFQKGERFLAIPRVLWVGLVLFLIADWTLIQSREVSEPTRMILVYDRSDSVSKIEERRSRVENFVKEFEEWAERESEKLQLFSIAEDLREENSESLRFGGFESRAQPLESLDRLDDVVIIYLGDGLIDRMPRSRHRVHAIQLGEEDEKDIWIGNAPQVLTAFLRNRVGIPFLVQQKGFTGQSLQVDLRRGNQIIESQTIRLASESTPVELSLFPDRMGEEVFEIHIRPLNGELSAINNRVSFVLRTVRDKIQVLHISGKPSPDLLAWRGFLTRQPDVDLVSFYILRSVEDDPQARGPELSLIPFPYDELFTTELPKFDVVVLQNFNFSLYFQPFYLSNVIRFVREGGGLLMIGGDQSFQSYALSPLAEALPFVYGPERGDYQTGNFEVSRVEEHPLTQSLAQVFTKRNWTGRHLVRSRESADTLLSYRDGIPFLSASQPGSGRILALNTDESWRLQMEVSSDMPFAFGSLARRLLQYLTFDPEMEPNQIESTDWNVGSTVKLSRKDKGVSDWKLRASGQDVWDKEIYAKKELSFQIPEAGVYEVWNSETDRTLFFETKQKPWRREWRELISRNKSLEELASRNDGLFLKYDDRAEVFSSQARGQEILALQQSSWISSSMARSWLIFIGIIFLFCLDLFLRKRFRWDS